MKKTAYLFFAMLQICLIQTGNAEDAPTAASEIPTIEQDFVNNINKFSKEQIIAQFGDPAKADDVKIKGTGKIVASIWQYHYIVKDAEGAYFETTELDFIDDKVVMVAFLNNDGAEEGDQPREYQVPTK